MVLNSPFPDEKLPQVPIAHYALEVMEKMGDSVAFIDPNTDLTLTFVQLRSQSIAFALKLRSLGVKKSDVVAVVFEFYPKCVPAVVGVGVCKAAVAVCNIESSETDLQAQMQLLNARFCICDNSALKEKLQAASENLLIVSLDELGQVKIVKDEKAVGEMLRTDDVDINQDTALIGFTSGSTGRPKAVALTNANLMPCILFPTTVLGLKPGDCMVTVCKGLNLLAYDCTYMCLMAGIKHVVTSTLSSDIFCPWLKKYNINGVYVADFVTLKTIVDEVEVTENGSLRFLITTGQSIPKTILQKAREKLKIIVASEYGSAEAGKVTCSVAKSIPLDSVGMLCPNVQLKVVDVNSRDELGPGQTGELCFKGPVVFNRYLDDREATAKVFDASGWYKSGDLGYYDTDGFIYVVDRLKNAIKSAGMPWVYSVQLEAVLLSHPGVAEAVVVRTSHPIYNEAAKAFVVKQDQGLTEGELLAYYNAKVAEYQQLFGGLEFIDHIPKTGLGKPLRRALERITFKKIT